MPGDEKPRHRSLVPDQLLANRYRIVSLLGHGGMGEVYEVEDTALGMHIALKTIRGEANETTIRRLQRELVMARQIAHPNICRVFDFGTDERAGAFYTMELLHGCTLAETLKARGPLSIEEARSITTRVADALHAAHSLGIVHRDLKPGNIFICNDGRVVVTDFGLARPDVTSPAGAKLDTASNIIAGTPAYMSPEQITGGVTSAAADLYALGVVMYEMTTGNLPWLDHPADRFTATPPPPGIEPTWDSATLRCLSVSPGRRFGSASELRLTLLGEKSVKRSWLPWAAVASVGVLILAGLGWKSHKTWTPRPEAMSWYSRGLAALHDGDYNSAARQLQMAVDADTNFAMAHARLAEAWAEQDYSDRARQAMLQASTVATNYPVAERADEIRLMAIQMTVARDFPGSVERYRQIAHLDPSVDSMFDLARALERNSETDEAIARLREAVMKQDSHAAAWARLGALLARKADYGGAATAFDKAEKLYNTAGNLAGVTEVQLRRAVMLTLEARIDQASGVLDSALKLAEATGFESQRVRILLRRGVLARLNEKSADSEHFASEALRLADENRMEQFTVEGLLDLGNVYLQKRDLGTAEKYYSSALRVSRTLNSRVHEAKAMFAIASVRSQQSRNEEAKSGAEKALAFFRSAGYKDETLKTLALLAQVRSQSGDSAGALAAFEEQLSLTPPGNARAVASAHLRIGISLAHLERYSEALGHLEAALKAPDSATRAYAALNKAEILVDTGALAEAQKLLADEKLFTEPSGMALIRAGEIRANAALIEAKYGDAIREADTVATRLAGRDPFLEMRVHSVAAVSMAKSGNSRKATALCSGITRESSDPRSSAAALLNCAEVHLATKNSEGAKKRAAEASALFSKLNQPEGQWHACTVEMIAASGEEAAAKSFECENIRKIVAERWGKDLWERYLTRADVRARLAKTQQHAAKL